MPATEVASIAQRLEAETRLTRPARLVFEWDVSERGTRFRGRGVARVEPPYRARLDLFLPGGETVARAALVDDELRIPAGVPSELLPPAHLLWATLGVFRPGDRSAPLGGMPLDDGSVLLRYGFVGGDEIRYTVRGSDIQRVELLRNGDVVQRVEVENAPEERFPAQATYRDMTAFRELRLSRESVEHVEAYPPDIWHPGR